MRHGFFGLFTLVSIMLSVAATAQPGSSYIFSQFTRPYEALGEGKIVAHSGWQHPFNLGLTLSTSIKFRAWGYDKYISGIFFNEKGQISLSSISDDGLVVSAAGAELKGSASWEEGFVNYYVEGDVGQRILKIEYEHVGFLTDDVRGGYISFQIWFYEKDNTIEIHYGPRNFEHGNPYLAKPGNVGVFWGSVVRGSEASVALTGDPASPTVGNNSLGSSARLDSFPAENTVYRFTPDDDEEEGEGEDTRIDKTHEGSNDMAAWYDPERRSIEIRSLGEGTVLQQDLYTIDGRKVMAKPVGTIRDKTARLNVSACGAGMYLLHMETTKGSITKKIYIY